MRRLAGAWQWLTILPIRRPTVPPAQAAVWVPAVAATLGYVGYLLFAAAYPWFGASLAALLAVGFWIGIGGGYHEDGLADTADALRAGRSRERMLEIMKDSRIGTYGALALILSVLARWQAVSRLDPEQAAPFVIAQAIPRAGAIVLARLTPAAGEGSAVGFRARLTTSSTVLVALQAIGLAFWPGTLPAAITLASAALLLMLLRAWFVTRLGGVTGDCLGAATQILETGLLLLFACRCIPHPR